MSASDFVIVGGGVIGLSIAFNLSRDGASVVVIDSDEPGQATSASAGMLAPLGESREPSPFVSLAVKALRQWPAFVETVADVSKVPLKINGPGMLRVAMDEEESREMRGTYNWQSEYGLPLQTVNSRDLTEIEPHLSREIVSAVLTPLELYVEPRTVLIALKAACIKRGVTILAGMTATSFAIRDGRVGGIRCSTQTFSAGSYIIAGGAWSRTLLLELGYSLPVHPVRGQIVAFAPHNPAVLKYTIYSHRGYLVPRTDGRIIAGATEERVGFDASTTESGISSLIAMARSILPALSESRIAGSWAGLRPISDDKMAIIGEVPGWPNVWTASGHGRNGILLAPYTGTLVADALFHSKDIPTIFSPTRFGSGA